MRGKQIASICRWLHCVIPPCQSFFVSTLQLEILIAVVTQSRDNIRANLLELSLPEIRYRLSARRDQRGTIEPDHPDYLKRQRLFDVVENSQVR